jgi:Tfp pilus assembly protein PilV
MAEKKKSRSRRGIALPTALVVMLLFAILCAAMFTLSHMSMTYDLYFERRTVLEHATVSMASAMALKLNDWSGPGKYLWTANDDDKTGNGSLIVDASTFGAAYSGPVMKFTFRITPEGTGKEDYLLLSVWGEYAGASAAGNRNMAWLVSMDVPKSPLPAGRAELLDIAFGSPDAHILWKK